MRFGGFLLRVLVAQAVVLVVVVSVPWVAVVVWPGALRPTAAVLCPEPTPDGVVVQYSEATSEGTGTSWTLVCLGPDGEVDEVGTAAPLALYFLGWLLALEAVVLGVATWRSIVAVRRRSG